MERGRHFQLPISTISPSNLTANVGPTSPVAIRAESRHTQKRKQTLLTLLDALTELNNQNLDQDSRDGTTLMDDESDGPTADEHLQAKGAEVFYRFQKSAQQLDKELQNFGNAVRQLGSSVGLLWSSFHLRQRLADILFLFRENAAELFPRKVKRDQHEIHTMHAVRERIQSKQSQRRRPRAPSNVVRPVVQEDLRSEDIPQELELLARDVTTFLECLNEFPEFTDEAVNASILAFEGDLKYWASCLREFEGQFRYPAVERYVHDLSGEIGSHIDAITATIGVFVEVGVPTIRFAQKHTATNLLNLSTVATFFSAVTATTIQFSFNLIDNPLQNAVNVFWFSSLVFSIASAVNSLLGLTWKQAMYRSPRHRVPWWVLIWIKRSPLIFLVISVAAFSVGLVLFTWGSGQHRVTCILTTVFTSISSFGLVAVSAWFAFERFTYTRHKGKRWLADILTDINADIRKYSGIDWVECNLPIYLEKGARWGNRHSGLLVSSVGLLVKSCMREGSKIFRSFGSNVNVEDDSLPHPNRAPQPEKQVTLSPPVSPLISHRLSDASAPYRSDSPIAMTADNPLGDPASPLSQENPTTPEAAPKPATTRFASAVRSVIMLQNASGSAPSQKSTGLARVVKAFENGTRTAPRRESSEPFTAAKLSRIIMLRHSLKHLESSETLSAHQALVRHLQFSPNGKWLATCSWDRTSVLHRVGHHGDSFTPHRTLAHPQGFVHQVAWSPSGTHILTKLQRSVKVWSDDGVCVKTIDRLRHIQSVTWMPSGKEFLLVEGNEVHRVDMNGKLVDSYHLPRLYSHDVAVTSDEQRIIAVATLTESQDGFQPHKARKEKRIVVYNLAEKQIESQLPVMHSVRDITIALGGQLALVSYEDKAPPQLWRLDMINDDIRLNLRHTYMPSTDVDFAGPSYFGGKDDQLIICAGKTGHINIWDRESAVLLHDFRVPEGDLTCVAWNSGNDVPMFATGAHDGAVTIWTSSVHQPLFSESRVASRAPSATRSGYPSRGDSPTQMMENSKPLTDEFKLEVTAADLSRHSSLRSS